MPFDFHKAGFKSGLEVHQRLDTKKLFCGCACDPNKQAFRETRRFHRTLHAVASEMGEMDPTARFEASRGRRFAYLVDDSSSCAVEADEEPPHPLNPDALAVALQVARQLNMRVADEIFAMRKQVLDGSAVSGFQRTALVATGGVLQTAQGNVRISSLCLEEESAGIMEGNGSETAYRLDRLGIPLLEIATEPDLKDGAHILEAAQALGSLLRATAKVQRGLGTIRQDLNVSIAGGARTEIKGAQDLQALPALAENEALRQHNLLELKAMLLAKPVSLSTRDYALVDVTDLLGSSPAPLVKKALAEKHRILALKLKGFSSLFQRELMPAHTFGREVAGYVRQHSFAKGFLHSDEQLQAKYQFSDADIASLRKSLSCQSHDLFALCMAEEATARRALEAVFRRCSQALQGVPGETRKADGVLSVFLRPIPGAARMYPETDVLPVRVSASMLGAVGALESIDDKRVRYEKLGLNPEMAAQMAKSPQFPLFESLLETNAEPALIAVSLLETSKSLKREGVDVKLADADWAELFSLYAQGKLVKAAVPELLKHKAASPGSPFAALLKGRHLHKFDSKQLAAALKTLPSNLTSERRFAEFMKRFRLNADPQEAKRLLE